MERKQGCNGSDVQEGQNVPLFLPFIMGIFLLI